MVYLPYITVTRSLLPKLLQDACQVARLVSMFQNHYNLFIIYIIMGLNIHTVGLKVHTNLVPTFVSDGHVLIIIDRVS